MSDNALKFTESHEWIRFEEDGTAYIGISDHAQTSLGDIVFVNLPEEGEELSVGDALGDVESVKSVSDIVSPVTGTVLEVNEELAEAPEKINEAPYDAWFVKVGDITEKDDLMDESDYDRFVKEN